MTAAELVSRFKSTFGPPERSDARGLTWVCGPDGHVRATITDRDGVAVVWIDCAEGRRTSGTGFRSSIVFTEVRDAQQASALVRYLDLLCVGRPVGVIFEAGPVGGGGG